MSKLKRITIIIKDNPYDDNKKASKVLFNSIMHRMNESKYLWNDVQDIMYESVESEQ